MKIIVLLLLAVIHQISAQTAVITVATDFATGVQQAQSEGKPIMAIISRSWCGACKKLIRDITSKSDEFAEFAKDVVIVESMDDSEPAIEQYGYRTDPYFPRIVFFGPSINLLNVQSPNSPQWPSYYASAKELIPAMRRAINIIRRGY